MMSEYELNFSSTVGTIRMFRTDPDKLIDEYENSVELLDERRYSDSLRSLRVCIENITKPIFANAFPDKDIPDVGDCINGLKNETENKKNLYKVLGEQLETAYHLCCKASHDDPYEVTEADAALTHHLFSRSVGIFHNRILHSDPRKDSPT